MAQQKPCALLVPITRRRARSSTLALTPQAAQGAAHISPISPLYLPVSPYISPYLPYPTQAAQGAAQGTGRHGQQVNVT